MPLPNSTNKLMSAPYQDIITILLTQFKRLLEQRDIKLTKAEIDNLGLILADKIDLPENVPSIQAALEAMVMESMTELKNRFDRSFAQSLAIDMSEIDGWDTTAEFLELANHKSNAELRISAGSSLLVALGQLNYADHLLAVIEVDAGVDDVDATIAKRILAYVSGIDLENSDWQQAVENWLETQSKTETQ